MTWKLRLVAVILNFIMVNFASILSINKFVLDDEHVSGIVKNIRKGKYLRAYEVAWSVSPFETSAVTVIAVSPVWYWYGWYFVPWRHKKYVCFCSW